MLQNRRLYIDEQRTYIPMIHTHTHIVQSYALVRVLRSMCICCKKIATHFKSTLTYYTRESSSCCRRHRQICQPSPLTRRTLVKNIILHIRETKGNS